MKKISSIFLAVLIIISPTFSVFGGPISGTTKYEKEGSFVQGPADVGGMVCYIPGYIVGSLLGLVYSPISGIKSNPKKFKPIDSMHIWGLGVGVVTFGVGYYIVGAPFYLVKKIFWNFPKKLITKKE